MAGETGIEPATNGFGVHYSASWATPLGRGVFQSSNNYYNRVRELGQVLLFLLFYFSFVYIIISSKYLNMQWFSTCFNCDFIEKF